MTFGAVHDTSIVDAVAVDAAIPVGAPGTVAAVVVTAVVAQPVLLPAEFNARTRSVYDESAASPVTRV